MDGPLPFVLVNPAVDGFVSDWNGDGRLDFALADPVDLLNSASR